MKRLRCPKCRALLGVPAGFRIGECPDCGALLGLAGGRRNPRAPSHRVGRGQGEGAFERFHGVKPRSVRKVQFPELPMTWWKIGDADGAAIEYVPQDYSERAPDTYRHEWGDLGGRKQRSTAKVLVSSDGRWLLVPPANFRVTERGIVG